MRRVNVYVCACAYVYVCVLSCVTPVFVFAVLGGHSCTCSILYEPKAFVALHQEADEDQT